MKMQSLLGLCLGGCLVFAGSAALADDKNKSDNRSARAVQVQIDKQGRKTAPDDSSNAAQSAAAKPSANVTMAMPSGNQVQQTNADGSVSVQLGTANLKYLYVSVDEDGQMNVTHRTKEELDAPAESQTTDKGEE